MADDSKVIVQATAKIIVWNNCPTMFYDFIQSMKMTASYVDQVDWKFKSLNKRIPFYFNAKYCNIEIRFLARIWLLVIRWVMQCFNSDFMFYV